MKILILTTHMNYGGISSYCFGLAKCLREKDHRVFIASSGGNMLNQLEKHNIRHKFIPINTKSELNPLVLLSLIKLFIFVRRQKIEIIHAQTRVTQVLAYFLSRLNSIPYVTTAHGFFKPKQARLLFPCWGETVIAISEAVKRHLMIDFSVQEKRIVLIHNGIDTKKFKVNPQRNNADIPSRTVGIIARLSDVKGHKYLIEAMVAVIQKFPRARLFIFGEGKMKYRLVRLAEKLKINEKVFFLPSVANTAEVLQEIDIFVMPSLQEGLGLSILEAQACAIPVIASEVGGIPSVIENNVTGILVPPMDSAALADAIKKIMSDKKLAIELGFKGKESAQNNFDLKDMADKVENLYIKVIKK